MFIVQAQERAACTGWEKMTKSFQIILNFYFMADYLSLEIKVTPKSFSSSMKGFFCILVLGEILVR